MTTFCIAIQKDIIVATCPLKQGDCYWQHRKTNLCRATDEELTLQQYCDRVGLKIPSADDLDLTREKLKGALSVNKG